MSLNIINNCEDNQQPELVAHFTHTFDIRDMAEPTDTIIGDMTVEDFKALSTQERRELIDHLFELVFKTENYGDGYGWLQPPQKQKYLTERNQLIDYEKLVEYGTTDSSEINQILDERKANEITRLRQERPGFGKIPDDFETLPEHLKICVKSMFMYFDEMRERFNVIGIDTNSMGNLNFNDADLEGLKKAGILIDEEAITMPEGYGWSYTLAPPYYECWVSRHYPVKSE